MNSTVIRILGIDPGSQSTGYGIIEKQGFNIDFVSCGTIRTNRKLPFYNKLLEIHQGLSEVITQYTPTVCAVEDMFVSNNPKSALKLGHARGVAILTSLQAKLEVHDYTPRMIKQAVVGYGQAEKAQIQEMVRILLRLSATPGSDAADALAVAICHAYRINTIMKRPSGL